jgi:membrane-associated phospholipid phosphatase
LNGFIQLTDELAENELEGFDTAVFDFFISLRNPGLTYFFRFMTEMGGRLAYIIISAALGAYFFIRHRNWKFIVQTISVLLLSTVTNIALKLVFNRARPAHEHLVKVYTLSYPSGHAMSAMAFYGFLIYLCVVSSIPRFTKSIIVIFLVLIILAIGTSRIYLGVHYPSDVAAGFIGGLIWVTLCIIVFNAITLFRRRRKARTA